MLQEVSLVSAAVNSARSRIVQSPDRIKKHISEMGILAQDERIVIAANETKTRDLKVKLDALNGFEQVRIAFVYCADCSYCSTGHEKTQ